jgi:hypothetical protein
MFQGFINPVSKRAPVLEGKNILPALFILGYFENFLVYTAVRIHIVTFWVRTPCSLVNGYERFGVGPGLQTLIKSMQQSPS